MPVILAYSRPIPTADPDPCADCEVRDISVCRSLDPHELTRLRAIMSTVHASAGRVLVREGDPADDLFNVISGAVKLYKLLPDGRRQVTGFLFAGDFLGITFRDSYAYTAEAMSPVRLCRFPRRALESLLTELPSLEQQLLGDTSTELAAAQDQMLLLGRKTARERVASFLLSLCRSAERHQFAGNPVALPMSRTDIADYLGLTTETVSRTVTALRRAGIIATPNRSDIEIVDRAALERVSENG